MIQDESKPSESCFASETARSTLSRYLVATELDVNIRNNAVKTAVVQSWDRTSGERDKRIPIKDGPRTEGSSPVIGIEQASSVPEPVRPRNFGNHARNAIIFSQGRGQSLIITRVVSQALPNQSILVLISSRESKKKHAHLITKVTIIGSNTIIINFLTNIVTNSTKSKDSRNNFSNKPKLSSSSFFSSLYSLIQTKTRQQYDMIDIARSKKDNKEDHGKEIEPNW